MYIQHYTSKLGIYICKYILHIYVIFLVFSYYIHISGYSQHTQHTLFKNPPDEPLHPWSFKEASMKIHGNKKYIQGGQGKLFSENER